MTTNKIRSDKTVFGLQRSVDKILEFDIDSGANNPYMLYDQSQDKWYLYNSNGDNSLGGSNVGKIIYSDLSQSQIDLEYGSNAFKLCNGQSCVGTLYQSRSGNSTVPDLRGQFLRVIDDSGLVDPDGVRSIRNNQSDTVGMHKHTLRTAESTSGSVNPCSSTNIACDGAGASSGDRNILDTGTGIGSETRPKNIALHAFIGVN